MSNKMKIIYVDDEEINVTLFNVNFSQNFTVLTGFSGFDGLELLEKHPDTKVVISDMKMPRMTGIDFIKKAKIKYPDKKFYILTGFEITDEIREALDSGLITKYFSKPFNIHEIDFEISKIENLVQ